MGANKHKEALLPTSIRVQNPYWGNRSAYFFSTDFARAGSSVNECYKKSIALKMNTQYPVFHPNGKRNGSFFLPRPNKRRKRSRKK